MLQASPPTVNEVVAVFPANLPFAVMSYSVAPTTDAQATEMVEAVEPVTPSEAGCARRLAQLVEIRAQGLVRAARGRDGKVE